MPLSRYQIRSEYSLADPDLYRVADKDDPEALLEGVAMAGLVGVLRQLGDLAEFAAEIFHDLHEEVMATASRGHGLIVRVQQLEAEFPSVERTLLSQTSHTSFLYNSGVDWHSNPRMDQNLVTQGDLPRFVMDSYEECRGPPRLFLLDKFDVAGAGACLKRYTDPSFFKVEATSSTSRKSEGQRDKKTRRVKKRGPRWRNGDTPDTFPSSHAKLHQLFLEERIESGGNDPERRVKLKKRQFTGSLFDQDKGKSYMEKFLDTCSPEQKIVHEVCIDALPLPWTSENGCESGLEIVEIGTVSPLKESTQAGKNSFSSPDTRDMVVKTTVEDFSDSKLREIIPTEDVGVPGLNHEDDAGEISSPTPKLMNSEQLDAGEISSPTRKLMNDEEFADIESKSEVSVDDGCNSDDAASEIDNYMDALATIDSEVETDSEYKKNSRYMNVKPIVVDSDASEGQRAPQSLFLDSQSVGNSVTSEEGTNFFKDRDSSSCSISVDTLAEATPDRDAATVAVASIPASNSDPEDMSFDHHSMSEEVPQNKTQLHAGGSNVAVGADVNSRSVQELGEASDNSCLTYPNTVILSVDKEASVRENSFPSPGLDEECSNSAEPDILSGVNGQGHANQTDIWQCNEAVLDAPDMTPSGHWSSGEHHMRDMAGGNSGVYSESLADLSNPHDNLVDLLQIESNTDSVEVSVKEHSCDLGMRDVDACVDIGTPAANQDLCDPKYPATVDPNDATSDVDFCTPSTEVHSEDQHSASDSMQGLKIQKQFSGTMNPDHTLPPDYAAEAVPSSEEDHSILITDVESEEKVSSASPVVGQTETLLPISSRSETHASELSSFKITDSAETAEGSLEFALPGVMHSGEPNSEVVSESADGKAVDNSMLGKSSPALDLSEPQDLGEKLSSEKTNVALLEHDIAEAGKQYPGSETINGGNTLSISEDEYKATLDVGEQQDVTPIYSNQVDTVETVKSLDDSETQVIHVDATSDHDCNHKHHDECKTFSHDAFPFGIPCKPASNPNSLLEADDLSDLDHSTAKEEHMETGTDGSSRVDAEDYQHEDVIFVSSSSSVVPEVQEQPVPEQAVSVTEECHQNEDELAPRDSAELAAQKHVDLVEDVQSIQKFVLEPLTSKNSSQDIESTSSNEIHLLEGKEDNADSLDHNLQDNESKVKPLHADESSSQPINYSEQIQASAHADKEGIIDATSLCYQGQPSVPTIALQSALCSVDSARQPMIEPTAVFPGENVLYGTNQAIQRVENSRQPVYSSGFPVLGMLPAEPQINLDSPPLPPLPPMQWRLSRFQNASTAPERQIVQHTRGPVQPMTLPTFNNETDTVVHTSKTEDKPEYSDGCASQQGVLLPMTDAVPEVSSLKNVNDIGREDNLSFTATSTSTVVQNNNQISEEESYQASNVNLHEPESLVESKASQPVVSEEKLNTETGVQKEQLEDIPKVEAMNSQMQFLPPSTVHFDWQPPPGLMAPDAGRTWSSGLDGIPTSVGGNANGTLQKKPQRPRNPLIDEVVAIDKSKLRKVERVKPPVESKPEEEESLLPQMQLRKVERVKPTVESKVEEGESLLEQLQLRKVGDRVKPPVEPKAEEREFSLEQLQLRKVGERVKSQVESKTEERELLLEQLKLRKVGERVKPEVEQKPEETESPKVQLRKLGERVKQEIEQKPEETESPRVQLRKVGERAHHLVGSKPEDRDSLFEQIRNKSFNLKPTVAARPNIQGLQGPRTNLKVAAILEKASNIRQAMAGSDEEDDADNWSDC